LRKKPIKKFELAKNTDLINNAIRFPKVLVIDENNEKIGEMSSKEAYFKAQDANLDLVCVSPTAPIPVCRIMDHGKYKFEKNKKQKDNRKNQKIITVKEIRMNPNIGEHDVQIKAKNAAKFINNGDKVKTTIRFRGREITHKEIGMKTLQRFVNYLVDIADVETKPKFEGRQLFCILVPKKK
jgi:translation initiation factor IF-3